MKKSILHFIALAMVSTAFFACSTNKKYSTRSFGGGWSEPKVAVVTPKTEAIPATETTLAETNAPTIPTETVAAPSTPNQNAAATAVAAPMAQKNATATGMVKKAGKHFLQKKLIKAAQKSKDGNTLLYIVIAFFIPFLGVALFEGGITSHFWIALLLTLLFWLPGFIYAILVIMGNI